MDTPLINLGRRRFHGTVAGQDSDDAATAPRSQHLDDLAKRLRDLFWRHCDRTATSLVEEQEEPVLGLADKTLYVLLHLAKDGRQTRRTEQGFAKTVATWGSVEHKELGGLGKDQRVQVVC